MRHEKRIIIGEYFGIKPEDALHDAIALIGLKVIEMQKEIDSLKK